MPDKPKPGSYIDTQGMGAPMSAEDAVKYKNSKQVYKPAVVTPRRLFTPTFAKELKILINEVLDERNGLTGISYFDTEHFKHTVIEDEPPYKDWKQ